jgi:putative aldouronate transport system permease protein
MTTSESTLTAPAVPARGGYRPGHPDGTRQEGSSTIRKRAGLRIRLRRDRSLVLMTLPAIALLLVFAYIPMLGNIVAFQDYSPFVGTPKVC